MRNFSIYFLGICIGFLQFLTLFSCQQRAIRRERCIFKGHQQRENKERKAHWLKLKNVITCQLGKAEVINRKPPYKADVDSLLKKLSTVNYNTARKFGR